MAQFAELTQPSPITGFAIAIASFHSGFYWASGTAMIIAPYLAITAKHIVDDHWRQHHGSPLPTGRTEVTGAFLLFAFQAPADGPPCLWSVQRIWSSNITDISILRLVPTSDSAKQFVGWMRIRINLLPPAVGSKIAAFGYHDSRIEPGDSVQWHSIPSNSHGVVTKIHHKRRDKARLTWPCFETDARLEGGMSGGPVFNSLGELCGLICSSMPPSSSGEPHSSWITSLWPMLGIVVHADFGDGIPRLCLMRELASRDVISVENLDRVYVHWNPASNETSVTLRSPKSLGTPTEDD